MFLTGSPDWNDRKERSKTLYICYSKYGFSSGFGRGMYMPSTKGNCGMVMVARSQAGPLDPLPRKLD